MRTTGIRLIADVDRFKRGFQVGAQSVRDLGDKVTGVGDKFKDMGRNARNAQRDIERSQAAARANLEALDQRINAARINLQKMSTAFARGNDDVVRQVQRLDRQITTVRRNLQRLSTEYVKGNRDVAEQIVEQQAEMRRLTSLRGLLPGVSEMDAQKKQLKELMDIRKLLPGVEDMQKAGATAGRGFHIGFMTISRPLAASLGSVLGGAILPLLPILGGTIAGLVIGGAGVGGVIGGIFAAAMDHRVQEAGEILGMRLMADLKGSAQQYIVLPLLNAMERIQLAWGGMQGDLNTIFAAAGRFIGPLTDALAYFLQRVTSGLAQLMPAAGPVIEGLSLSISALGAELERFFANFADDGVSAAVALQTTFAILNSLIRTIGIGLNALTETFGFLARIGAFGRDVQREFLRMEANAKLAKAANEEVAASLGTVRGAGQATAATLSTFTAEIVKTGGPTMAAARAADAHARAVRGEDGALKDLNNTIRAQIDPLFAFTQAQKKVKEAQDAATEAVKKHGANSEQAKNATRTLAGAALDLQGKAGKLTDSFNGRLTPSMKATFEAAGLTKGEIKRVEKQLIEARKAADKYEGKYDAKVTVSNDKEVVGKLTTLSQIQQALKKGTNLPMRARAYFGDRAGFHDGGYTGPGGKYEPAGVVHRDEFVIRKESRAKIERKSPGLLEEMNATGQLPAGYAVGGRVTWPYPVTAAKTRVPSVEEAMNAVVPNFGSWPSSPQAQRGDSGVWKRIVAMIRATGPMSGSFGNAYRHGDPKWHGSGRAVDWMGFNQDRLARFLAARRPLELIHRTNSRDYAYTRGRNMGSFNQALMNAHRNHIHIAMEKGDVIREPVLGIGASGRSYSFAESGPERILSVGQTAASAGVVNNIQVTVHAPVGSHPREIGREINMYLTSYLEGGGRTVVHGNPVLP